MEKFYISIGDHTDTQTRAQTLLCRNARNYFDKLVYKIFLRALLFKCTEETEKAHSVKQWEIAFSKVLENVQNKSQANSMLYVSPFALFIRVL